MSRLFGFSSRANYNLANLAARQQPLPIHLVKRYDLILLPSLSSKRRHRLPSRLVKHHLPLLLLSVACVWALYVTRPYTDVLSRASFATAYPALVLLGATLVIGPLNLLRHRPNPVSIDLRRDLGIWAGFLAIVHTAIGQCVHMRGRPWLYYIYGPAEHHHGPAVRHDLFGFANYTGAFATLVVVALFATSNDYSLRALGTRQWKQLQRGNYAAAALVAMHAFGYQGIEKQHPQFVAVVIACVVITLAFQRAGFLMRGSAAARKI
jgi:sulfoxide reductase heme-binding subunit YedZ